MKTFLRVLSFVVFPAVMLSQGTGFKVGATISNWQKSTSDTLYNIANSTNFAIVGIQSFGLGGGFSIQLEPTYSLRSFDMLIPKNTMQSLAQLAKDSLPTTKLPNELSFTQKFASLECPILLRYDLKEKGIRPYLFAGPNVSVSLSATAKANFDTTNLQLQKPLDVKPEASGAVFSIDAGAGVQIPLLLSIEFVADARYTFALSDVSKFSTFGQSLSSAKASDVRVFAGLVFNW